MPENSRLIILAQYFYPEVASTAQLMTELAVDLHKEYNLEVIVYTGQPSYDTKDNLPKREVHEGVIINRVFNTQFSKNHLMGRIFNWGSFFLSVWLKLAFSRNKAKYLIVGNPPFLPFVGWFLKKIKRRKFVSLVNDIYPDMAVKLGYLGPRNLVVKIWDKLNHVTFEASDSIIVLGNRMKETIVKKLRNEGDSPRVQIIHSWADGDFIKPLSKEENWFAKKHELVDKIVVLYSGNIGQLHDLETIIEAADRLRTVDDLMFLFIGDGGKKEKLQMMVRERRLEDVKFLPFQPKENLPYSLTCGDISVVTLEKGVEGLAVPCKLYTTLASGLPVLGLIGENSEVADIIKEYNCGFRADQGDADKVVEILKECRKNPVILEEKGKNARACFEENFTRKQAVEKYHQVLSNI